MTNRNAASQPQFLGPYGPPRLWNRAGLAALLVAVAIGATACQQTTPPWLRTSAGAAQARFQGPAPPAVVIQRGDTVYALSRRYGIPMPDIIRANRLSPPYVLQVGQRLVLPRPQLYVVQRGDTLYGIARSYGVDMHDLAALNRIGPPYNIWVGQRLALPGQAAPSASVQVAAGGASATVSVTPPVPASRPAVPNSGAPSGSSAGAAASSVPPTPAPRPWTAGSTAQTPTSEAPVTPWPKPTVPHQSASAGASGGVPSSVPPPPARAGQSFAWPAMGQVIAEYGPSTGGARNDGINIAVSAGTLVRAAENGVVVYAGNELKGFGNLLLVKHANGWMTAYAHNELLIAKRGETVARGQVIARAGQTGNVDSPQIHFEIRRNSKAVDPMEYLERPVARR